MPVTGRTRLDRITLTYPALASSAVVAFFVAGERKREALARARAGDPALPAAAITAGRRRALVRRPRRGGNVGSQRSLNDG